MALLLSSVFGVTGCGSDDDVQVESRVKNAAPEASGASDAPSEADCDLDDLDDDDFLDSDDHPSPGFINQHGLRSLRDDLMDLRFPSIELDFEYDDDIDLIEDILDGLDGLDDLERLNLLDRLDDLGEVFDLKDLDRLFDQCGGVSDLGTDAPEGYDVDGG
jgi:hypothetical protein